MTASADLAIRLRRAAFNQALADADIAAIGPILAEGCIMVTGSDSAVITGRKAQVLAWKREFAASPRLIYIRTPSQIMTSPVEPIAFEHGHWQGVHAAGATPLASGSYTAKWRDKGGEWLIEAELFLTLG